MMVKSALQAPAYTIAVNAGAEGAVIVGKLLEQDSSDFGFDAAKGFILAELLFIIACIGEYADIVVYFQESIPTWSRLE
jgi:hypothetical protein